MKRHFTAAMATVALIVACHDSSRAQDAGTQGPPQPTTPPAAGTTPPAGATPPSDQTATPPAASGTQLPEVKVIQEQQKAQPKPVQAAKPKPVTPAAAPPVVELDTTVTPGPSDVQMSPLSGSEIPIAKVPSGVSTVSSPEIARTRTDYVADALATYVPGVIVSDYQGNGFQTNVDFRGFQSSPVDGIPQGLAVYQNGVRINESFGDTVNYDFLPTMAIQSMVVMSGNPVFGLNAIGGAISIDMKDGFKFQGFESDTRFGSYGRAQESIEDGRIVGNWATYIAADYIHDNGFRTQGLADIRRMYADLGVRGDGSEFHLNFTGADNTYGVATATPVEILDQSWSNIYTNPQSTTNQVEMVSLNGQVKASDTLNLSGVAYYRHFNQQHLDGNISNATPCPINQPGPLTTGACFDNLDGNTILLQDLSGNILTVQNGLTSLGELDRTSVDTNAEGASLQGVDKSKLWDRPNQFLLGGSIDHGEVAFGSSAELATFGPNFSVIGTGQFVGPSGTICDLQSDGSCTPIGGTDLSDIRPVSISTINTYYGLYFLDTFDATDRLTLTAGGRFNWANLEIHDETGSAPNLNSNNFYFHFNPVIGGTYKLRDDLSAYASFSEANRAPVPAELACADPLNPCLLPSFLTGDPPLQQVVSYTEEVGLKGERTDVLSHQKLTWSLGFFSTLNTNDIISITSTILGRSYFANAGDTLRQGVEAQVDYWSGPLFLYAGYNFVNATFQGNLTLQSPFNPAADANGDIFVHPGDRIPGVPAHKFKAGFDYGITPRWKFGADLIAATNQYFFGDESNQNAPLGGYAKVNLHTSYDVTDHIQIYGLIDNLFDAHYGVYGTYFDVAETNDSFGTAFLNPETIVPAPPITAYGGVKVKF